MAKCGFSTGISTHPSYCELGEQVISKICFEIYPGNKCVVRLSIRGHGGVYLFPDLHPTLVLLCPAFPMSLANWLLSSFIQ